MIDNDSVKLGKIRRLPTLVEPMTFQFLLVRAPYHLSVIRMIFFPV